MDRQWIGVNQQWIGVNSAADGILGNLRRPIRLFSDKIRLGEAQLQFWCVTEACG
jgi:hypothetical protein